MTQACHSVVHNVTVNQTLKMRVNSLSDYAAFIGPGVTTKLIKSIDKTTYETPYHPECNLDYVIRYLTMNGESNLPVKNKR